MGSYPIIRVNTLFSKAQKFNKTLLLITLVGGVLVSVSCNS